MNQISEFLTKKQQIESDIKRHEEYLRELNRKLKVLEIAELLPKSDEFVEVKLFFGSQQSETFVVKKDWLKFNL